MWTSNCPPTNTSSWPAYRNANTHKPTEHPLHSHKHTCSQKAHTSYIKGRAIQKHLYAVERMQSTITTHTCTYTIICTQFLPRSSTKMHWWTLGGSRCRRITQQWLGTDTAAAASWFISRIAFCFCFFPLLMDPGWTSLTELREQQECDPWPLLRTFYPTAPVGPPGWAEYATQCSP